ncbi:MAG: PorP/SprF family type IX secretion system membrane protein [Bacteroidales bacterium]|nr:PorP/SprF family type IX secretion system membrane protein [Bacteroidales bacterium]
MLKLRDTLTIKLAVMLIMILSAANTKAQIIQFSQFYSCPLFLAPSYAGAIDNSRVVVNYRNQWPEAGTFNTYAASYDQHLYKIKSGIGLMLMRDEAGDGNLALTVADICYSWYTKVSRDWTVRPGISFKYNKRSIDFEKLIFGDMIDEKGEVKHGTAEAGPSTNKPYTDMQVSCIGYSEKYWGGLSVDHLLRPKASLYNDDSYREDMKISVFGGAKFFIGATPTGRGRRNKDDMQSVSVTALYEYSKLSDQLSVGAYWNKLPFTLGMWVRGIPIAVRDESYGNLDAIILLLGYKIFDLHIGYSYDFSVGELLSTTGGAHEISVMYEFQPKAKAKKRHAAISCPKL